jgi:hypothetical protein
MPASRRESPLAGVCVTGDELNQFLDDLRTQLGLYRDMVALNARQMELLSEAADANPNDLMALVGRKQHLMEAIAEVETRVRPQRDGWQKSRDALEPEVRAEAEALLAELSATIRELIEMEDQAHRRLESAMMSARQGIETIRKKSQVNRAYAAYGAKPKSGKVVDAAAGADAAEPVATHEGSPAETETGALPPDAGVQN